MRRRQIPAATPVTYRPETTINDPTPLRTDLSPSALTRLRKRVIGMLPRRDSGVQGIQFDPADVAPPDRSFWRPAKRAAMDSPHLATFADLLRPPSGGSVRDGVIGDLAEYHELTQERVVDRCLRSEYESAQEWQAAADLDEFYNSIDSWTFNLLWYAYLQTAGFGYPETIVVANRLGEVPVDARMLDLGSGVGTTAQFFAAIGYEVTLADVSPVLLDFARWRLERRGVKATYLHLPADLPEGQYELVTALDVMAHVADTAETARQVHRALQPGGLFVANFDVRPKAPEHAWHLYEDDLPLRWAVERAGFVPVGLIDKILWVYQARPTTGFGWRVRTAVGWLRLASPPARAVRAARRACHRALRAVVLSVINRLGIVNSTG